MTIVYLVNGALQQLFTVRGIMVSRVPVDL
jgi:hypothetical protein